jgi:LytS/YehU family sensor histidine kinase
VHGGQVQVQARAAGDRLHIDVRDDGLGLQAAARRGSSGGHGVALANLRERLRSRYGSRAQLDLADAQPGTQVRLSLPLEIQA